jgi:hypothetical protein
MTRRALRPRFLLAAGLAAGLLAAPSSAAAPADADLRITTSHDYSGGTPTEGSVSEIEVNRVVRGKLTPVFQATVQIARPITVHLRPGTYRTAVAVRTCSGNCGYLDPPAARCSRTTLLRAGDRVRVVARFTWGDPTTCRMSLLR